MAAWPVRTSTKAVIVRNGRLLAVKHRRQNDYYTLPGGGQNFGEDLKSSLVRECIEEAGTIVDVRDLLFVRDYIEDNHEFAGKNNGFHQLELFFECAILNPDELLEPTAPDDNQVGLEWLPVDGLGEYLLYPQTVKGEIVRWTTGKKGYVYLGDVN